VPAPRRLLSVTLVIVLISGLTGVRCAIAAPVSAAAVAAAARGQASGQSGDDYAPWRFFADNVRHADSFWKFLELIVYTVLFSGLYAAFYLPYIVLAIAVFALINARMRGSTLVRAGLLVYVGGLAALFVAGRFNDNPLGFGFLYSLTRPVGAFLMMLGAVLSPVKTDRAARRAVGALAVAADARRPIWPDHPPLPELDRVARQGTHASPALAALLGSKEPPGAPSIHVEQQAELALCRIYGVTPETGRTVSDARASRDENQPVRDFWLKNAGAR
jgi:hypothetical protein